VALTPSQKRIALVAVLAGVAVAVGAGAFVTQSRARASAEARRDETTFEVDRCDVPAPSATVQLSNGGALPLGAQPGRVLFVNFWATWCPPCRAEMPSMLQLGYDLSRKYPGKFQMIAVSVDDGWPEVEQFFGGQLPPFLLVARDPDMVATRGYFCAARGGCPEKFQFPETYIVDAQGRLVRYIVGPRDWSDPAARRVLERLIEG
jgi:thiol-disulfide isomerase/thioredoxin